MNAAIRAGCWSHDMQRAEREIWRGITGGEERTVTLDPEAINELRALGYLD
jgi:hypothetical protein